MSLGSPTRASSDDPRPGKLTGRRHADRSGAPAQHSQPPTVDPKWQGRRGAKHQTETIQVDPTLTAQKHRIPAHGLENRTTDLGAKAQRLAAPVINRVRAAGKSIQRATAPVVKPLKPYLDIVRPAGWACLAIGVVALIVGLVMGWAEFLVAAVFLGVMLIVAVVFVLGRSTYTVDLDMTRLRVVAGTDAFGGLTITNSSDRPVLPCMFLLPVGKGMATFPVPKLAGKESFEESFQVDTRRRAVIPLGPVRSSRGDSLGLFRREVTWTGVLELFVHPKTISLNNSSAGFLKDLEGRPTDTLSSSDIAFHALRDYVVGDDLRHIHWKSSAHSGRLLVRQFEETRRSHLVICLSMTPDDYETPDDFELAASVAASLGAQAIREEKDLTINVPGEQLHTQTGARMLDDFSRLDFGKPCEPIEEVAIAAAAMAPDASVAVVVLGTTASPAKIHSATVRFPVDANTIVIRCHQSEGLSRGMIGDTPLLSLGNLDDLPRAMGSLGV